MEIRSRTSCADLDVTSVDMKDDDRETGRSCTLSMWDRTQLFLEDDINLHKDQEDE